MAQKPRGRPKAFNDKTDQNTVQALDRGLEILSHVALNPGRTLSEIAEDTGEAIATVFRALVTLQGHGMVEVDEPGQFWHIGPGAFRVGSAFLRRTKVVERARQPMDALMRETGETANLGIEVKDEVFFVAQVETYALGGAFELALMSDISVAGHDAKIGMPGARSYQSSPSFGPCPYMGALFEMSVKTMDPPGRS